MPRQGARISLILAFVFPAIVAATLALSTYGFRYAKSASERSKASLMDGNRQLAQALAGSIQQRIDTADFELFKEIEWDDSDRDPPSDVELPKGIDLKLYTAQSEVTSERKGGIRFYPDGSSTGGRITLSAGERKYLVDVDWLTGRVSIED